MTVDRQKEGKVRPFPELFTGLVQTWMAAGGEASPRRSGAALAACIGLEPSIMPRFRTGARRPAAATLSRLCDVVKPGPEEIVELYAAAGHPLPQSLLAHVLTPTRREQLQQMLKLTDEQAAVLREWPNGERA